MLVSPTEPKLLRTLGKTSLVPESYGVDFLFTSPVFGLVGVQRKEIKDLVASVNDGRLAKELAQMKALGQAMIVIEGKPQWSNDGSMITSFSRWTIAQHLGTMWSMQLAGYWIATSASVDETSVLLSLFGRWIEKSRHVGLVSRPKPKDEFGRAGNRDWGIHLLQSFQGIGAEVAGRIYDHFDGVPLRWTVSEMDLLDVEGIGKTRAKSLMRSLQTYEIVLEER